MAVEKDFELLDDYISNRLTEKERVEFEQKLASDPELASELELQQKIVERIRQARVAQLKTMLNNVAVGAVPSSASVIGKITAIATTVGLIATGLYFYFNSDNKPTSEPERTAITDTLSESSQEEVTTPETKEPVAVEEQQEENVKEPNEPKQSTDKNTTKRETPKPSINVFEPTEEENTNEKVVELPNETTVSTKAPSFVVETDNTNKKYKFHYQFKDGKLFLFGSFEKNLYEIMEFFSDNKRTVFLFYKNNYYLLNEDNDKVKSLSPINDPVLLKRLREYRAGDR